MTIAQKIAALLGDDGEEFTTSDGRTLTELAWGYYGSRDVHERNTDHEMTRWTFPDESVITIAQETAWDLGYPNCYCWVGCGRECSDDESVVHPGN